MVLRGHVVGAAAVALLAACGNETEPLDAPGPCWPLQARDGGEVEIGTGDIVFEPMPDVLSVVKNASQSDPFIPIHSRIRGMPPGDPEDPFDRRNPRTKVGVTIDELGLVLGVACPASIGYIPAGEPDTFDLVHSLRVGFGMNPVADANGKQARITVEVVGSNGLYARAEKLVTLDVPPTGGGSDAGVDASLDAAP